MTDDRSLPTKHKVKRGETLWDLARYYYGMASKWPLIQAANADATSDPAKIRTGSNLDIPALAPEEPLPQSADARVKIDIANLEGRKLLQQPVIMLNGVGEDAARVLKNELKIVSIFDLALSRIFNAARDLAEASGIIAAEYTRHSFIPGDVIRGDPQRIKDLDDLLRADVAELNFFNQDDTANDRVAGLLKQALPVITIRDLALWPPFVAAREILTGTFNPSSIPEDDPEAPADLIPKTGNFATERVYYKSAVLTEVEQDGDAEPLEEAGAIDLAAGQVNEGGFTKPATGLMITTEQAWFAQGVTLGQLLHSLTLAPGESTKVAVVDWTRRAFGRSDQSVDQLEQLSQITDQARSITEVTNALTREELHGSSLATGTAAGGQAGVSGGFLGLVGGSAGTSFNTSVATNVSHSAGRRSIDAAVGQDISSRTQQHATSARSRRAAIVQETFEAESETATTRVVTNYNHMHTMSVQYYQVVQVYRVKTRPVHYDRVLFIPMKVLNFRQAPIIARYREVLQAFALPPMRPDRIKTWRPSAAPSVLEPRNNVNPIRSDIAPRGWELLNENADEIDTFQWTRFTGGRLERVQYHCAGAGEIQEIRFDPRFGDEPIVAELDEEHHGSGDIELRPLALDSISRIELVLPAEAQRRSRITLVYHLSFRSGPARGARLRQYVDLPTGSDRAEPLVLPVAEISTEVGGSDEVMDHLNENALYYSQAIWLNADSLALSQVLAQHSYRGASVIASIDPQPVAMTGNYLGFRWNFGSEDERTTWLQENGLGERDDNRFEAMVPLPSGGVFAEAVLGRFNAAEKLDLSRFWNWQDSPIPILPPGIDPVTLGSRAQAPDLKIDGLDPQAVQIGAAPALPDPTGLQAVLQNLTAANVFRDITGLTQTAGLAQAGLQAAATGASSASADATKAYEIATKHHQAMTKLAIDAAKEIAPLVAGPAGLGVSSLSKAGAVMNLAGKLDGGSGGTKAAAGTAASGGGSGDLIMSAFRSLIGRFGSGKGGG